MRTVITIGKLLVWIGIVVCGLALLGLLIGSACEATYKSAAPMYVGFIIGMVTMFIGGLVLAFTPEPRAR